MVAWSEFAFITTLALLKRDNRGVITIWSFA
jgi:hypothetical protein